MRIAIMQPTWLPWSGYFDLIDQVDLFVFLDSVQYTSRSWQCRNRVRTRKGLEWLSVPVRASRTEGTTLAEATVLPGRSRVRKWSRMLEQAYARAPAVDAELPPIIDALRTVRDGESLASVNIRLINRLAKRLEIETPTIRATSLPDFPGRVDRLVDICRHLGADTFVTTPGTAAYIRPERSKFQDVGVALVFHRFDHPVYRQCHAPFMAYASVLDLLLNCGARARAVLRSGQRQPVSADALYREMDQDDASGRGVAVA